MKFNHFKKAIVITSIAFLFSVGTTFYMNSMINNMLMYSASFIVLDEEVEQEEDIDSDEWDESFTDDNIVGGTDDWIDSNLQNGIYPSDTKLRVRAQVLELSQEIAKLLNTTPYIPFMLAQAESSLRFDYNDYDNMTNPDIYRDLIKPIQVHNDYMGHELDHFTNEDYRTGQVIKDNGKLDFALGPFQFETDFVDKEVPYIYQPIASGNQNVSEKVLHMSQYDNDLDINRPHTLYMPDAMYNLMHTFSNKMNEFKSLCENDSRWGSVPKEIQDLILYTYSADSYRGTMNVSYKNGGDMHKAMVSFYIDIYETYGSFDFMAYSNNRTLIMGTQRNNGLNGWAEWDGTLDEPIVVGGVTYHRTLLQEMTEKTQTGYNYMELFNKIENHTHSERATYNKLGLAHGMRGLDGMRVYDEWLIEVTEALNNEYGSNGSNGGADGNNDNVPIGTGGIPGIQLPTPLKSGYAMEVSSQYGWRSLGGSDLHLALDMSGGGQKVPLYSILDGVVVQIGDNTPPFSGYGNAVRIRSEYNGNTYITQYSHMNNIDVALGDNVKAGQKIGNMGNTGTSAIHLHLEVEVNSTDEINHSARNRINPLILYGYNPNVHNTRQLRNEWFYAQNFNLQHTTSCNTTWLLDMNERDGYKMFNCRNHLDISASYPD